MATVPEVILEQLGGSRFIVMTGARDFVGDGNTLSMKLRGSPRINYVRVTLEANDTYTMKFYKLRGMHLDHRGTAANVYADMLQEVFTRHTGLDTHL